MEEVQIVVDVKTSPLSSESMQHKLDTLCGNTNEANNFTIFRTPHNISQSKKNLFEPSVVSIGPFHHGQKHLRALEEQKWWFLKDFMSRGDHISLDLCMSEMELLEERTRRCYSETVDLGSSAFVEMMLLDGCFVLEYMLKLYEGSSVFFLEVGWGGKFIDFDLLLLENQIPFFIVEKLYEISLEQEDRLYFVKFIAHNFVSLGPTKDTINTIIPNPPAEIHHLVHLFYHYLVPQPDKPDVLSSKSFDLTRMFSAIIIMKGLLHWFCSSLLRGRSAHSTSANSSEPLLNSTGNLSSMVIPCATELKEAGLKFKQKSNPKHMLDISFKYGVLKIPRLAITDSTKPMFANLIAFEQSKYGKENSPFTSFVYFLDNLVNTANDVTILQECGIFENWLSSEEELTQFINQVTEGATLEKSHYLAELNREVNKYIGSSWHRQRAKLIRDYFSGPWATLSLVAAFILLVLTFVQSFFAVYAYKYPPSS